jgi:hypothetical protein
MLELSMKMGKLRGEGEYVPCHLISLCSTTHVQSGDLPFASISQKARDWDRYRPLS